MAPDLNVEILTYNARSLFHLHIILRQFSKKLPGWNAYFRAVTAATGNCAACQHAPGDGERHAGIERARAETPAPIGQHDDLLGDLQLLPACFACDDDAQHIAILRLDRLSRGQFKQPCQHLSRRNVDPLHAHRLVAAEAEVNEKLELRQKVAGEAILNETCRTPLSRKESGKVAHSECSE